MHFSWLQAHGALTHFPIALLIAALAFEAGGSLFRRARWRDAAVWMLAAGAVMAVPALLTGWLTSRSLFSGAGGPPPGFVPHWRFALIATALAFASLALRVMRRERSGPARRGVATAVGALAAMAVGVTGYLGGDMVLGGRGGAQAPGSGGTDATRAAVARNRRAFAPGLVSRGYRLVVSDDVGCRSCHRVDGKGGRVGPDLSTAGLDHPDIAWQIEHLRDPRSVRPGSPMPAYDHLTPAERFAIAAWLVTRGGSQK